MNFTWVLTPPDDGEYGSVRNDGSWTGLIGELVADKIDIGESTA